MKFKTFNTFFFKILNLIEQTSSIKESTLQQLEALLPKKIRHRLYEIKSLPKSEDIFGMNLPEAQYTLALCSALYCYYFRCQTTGVENIPDGPVILVANHAGQIPIDAMMVTTALVLESETPIFCRSMMDKMVPTIPVISSWYNKLGVVLGTPENASRLLNQNQKLLTFPEGIHGIQKPLSKAYELEPFGSGFLRLAMEHNVPIVPVSIVGSEEQYPTLYNLKKGTQTLGIPSVPIWLQLPIPLWGLLPLPVKYYIHFDTPKLFRGDPDETDSKLAPMIQSVKDTIDLNILNLRNQRKTIFY